MMHRLQKFTTLLIVSIFTVLLPATAQPITIVPTDLNLGDKYHLAFVTSTTRDATSDDINDYDAFVQAAADAAGNGLGDFTWLVIGSTATVDARDHTNVTAPVYRLDDTRIADGFADLWAGPGPPGAAAVDAILAPIEINELGALISTPSFVWTGTNRQGRRPTTPAELGNTQVDTSQGVSGVFAVAGRIADPNVNTVGKEWIKFDRQFVDSTFSLYAISEELTVIPEPSTMLLFGSGLAGLGFFRWRKKAA